MKPYATVISAGTSLGNRTGSWRTERPEYVHRLPPCNKACPAGENIQEWLSFVEREAYEEAWREIVKNNPMPAVMGRVCYHPCESACNRAIVDGVVGINSVERFLGDEALKQGWRFTKPAFSTGKRILIVGAGPAGLSAAYHLALSGHQAIIKERQKLAGGMMRYGIPAYRLPRTVLDAEIKRILDLGVELQLGTKVDDLAAVMDKERFNAVFLSVGAQSAQLTDIPSADGARILDAVSVLEGMENGNRPDLGQRVAVYGGGNTALDVARTAKRLGAKSVTIIYRRTRDKMPAHSFEVEEALQEGIGITFLSTIKSYQKTNLTLEKMKLDTKGLPQPTGETETMEADSVILALGQVADLDCIGTLKDIQVSGGLVTVDERMMTGRTGVFAGGDMVPSARTVTAAIGHGKKAAHQIDLWLGHKKETPDKHGDASSDRLNVWYYDKSPRIERDMVTPNIRVTSFDEVQKGLSPEQALAEARRCLSCGNCFECDNCYGVCPDNAIKKLGKDKGFVIDYDYCKGCGLCANECPCGCIDMVPEDI